MILADTSVWIEHLGRGISPMPELLNARQIAMHAHVIGELACGNLAQRPVRLRWLREIPRIGEAFTEEVLQLIEDHALMGRGVGWIDCHLLASARLHDITLWTLDARLAKVAAELEVAFAP